MIHLYERHIDGRYYTSDKFDDSLLETCEMCWGRDLYIGCYVKMEEVALEMFREGVSQEHIAEVTGLNVIIDFEKLEEK